MDSIFGAIGVCTSRSSRVAKGNRALAGANAVAVASALVFLACITGLSAQIVSKALYEVLGGLTFAVLLVQLVRKMI